MEKGWYAKYTIIKNSDGSEVTDGFVLRPRTDTAARTALITYAHAIAADNPQLASDILHTIADIYEEELGNE